MSSVSVDPFRTAGPRLGVLLLAAALLLSFVISTRGITDEAAASLHGDVPRHMMNGVFLWDLLRSGELWPVERAVTYAEEYFARYPALSIGHHAPLTAMILVPFYAVFGISVFAARLAMVVCMLTAIAAMYSLTRRLYGPTVAGWASLLLAVQPEIVPYGQRVMSEGPLLALVLLTIDALLRFWSSGRAIHYLAFVVLAATSLYAKQTAAFLFPLYGCALLVTQPARRLVRRDVLLATLLGVLLCAPILLFTLAFAPHNVAVVMDTTTRTMERLSPSAERIPPTPPADGTEAPAIEPPANGTEVPSAPPAEDAPATEVVPPDSPASRALRSILDVHLSPGLIAAMVVGLIVSTVRRDGRIAFALLWIAAGIAGVVLLIGPYEAPRYAILAIPAYSLLAAASATADRPRALRWLGTGVLVLAVLSAAFVSARRQPVGAGGYEAAAEYVAGRTDSPTVLYSASADTGYFVFFVRKHDDSGNHIVLRADKMLTTSLLGALDAETHIQAPEDIYALLRKYGTRLIVIEDHPTGVAALDWLRDELRGPNFVERHRVPIASRDHRVAGVDLVTYEYVNAAPPDLTASIDIALPIVGRGLEIRLSDLMDSSR